MAKFSSSMNINLSFKDLTQRLKNNLGTAFFLMLLIVLVLDGFVLKNSYLLVFGESSQNQPVHAGGVRVNFTTYDAVVKRIDAASNYQPPSEQISNPFLSQ